MNTTDLHRMLSNPFYCLNLSEELFGEHEPMVTEKEWIAANEKMVKEMGFKKWAKELLENLKGNYIISED